MKDWKDKEEQYNLAVVIGRLQPLHYGHIYNIEKGLTVAKKVLVLIGSAYNSVSPKNPFTYEQREKMITDHYRNTKAYDNIYIEPLPDNLYEENQWLVDVQEAVTPYADNKVVLIGHEKDNSSYYLKHFPQWNFMETGKWPEKYSSVDATTIRELYFKHDLRFVAGVVPGTVYQFLEWFSTTEDYSNIVDEYNFLVDYKKAWSHTPYPNTFNTVDAVVVQSGHILLVRRKDQPGRGLYAMPGGFIQETERQEDAAIRELREETKLKVPVPVLRGSIVKEKTFDHPLRSQRGRTITQAFLFQLKNEEELPKVKGSDDAKEAMWVPLNDFYSMEHLMYEDHYYIIKRMIDNE
jgi:bifunctional NMN adenylyltransferase/nudix hydrolase